MEIKPSETRTVTTRPFKNLYTTIGISEVSTNDLISLIMSFMSDIYSTSSLFRSKLVCVYKEHKTTYINYTKTIKQNQ